MPEHSNQSPARTYRPWLHRLAIALLGATFALILLGATVTSKGVGLAVPDWPTTFGYNMFLFPPSMWVGGLFWEHTHRLLGSAVGLIAIATAVSLWWTQPNKRPDQPSEGVREARVPLAAGPPVRSASVKPNGCPAASATLFSRFARLSHIFSDTHPNKPSNKHPSKRPVVRLAFAVLALVIIQGVMGGLRVTQMSIAWAILHAVTGQIVLCSMIVLALATGRFWIDQTTPRDTPTSPRLFGSKMRLASYAVLAVLLTQIVLGAATRHTGSGLAIPDFPTSYGRLLPPLTQSALTNRIDDLPYEQHTGDYTIAQVALHFSHRAWAVVVLGAMAGWLVCVLRKSPGHPALIGPVIALAATLLIQVMMGAMVIWTGRHPEIATTHTALGAVLMAVTTLLTVRIHLVGPHDAQPRTAATQQTNRNPFPPEPAPA